MWWRFVELEKRMHLITTGFDAIDHRDDTSNLKKETLTGKLANGTGPVSAELRLQKVDRLRAHLRSLPPDTV